LRIWTLKRTRRLTSPEQVNMANMPSLSFSAQNCNSLNISTNCEKQFKKLLAIISLGSDVIFLSDIGISNNNNISDLENVFRYNNTCQYDFVFNSSLNRRGCGILINRRLDYSITDTLKDANENILSVTLSLDNYLIRAVSVYSPNVNDRAFFTDLNNILQRDRHIPTVLGGDWNMTVSINNSEHNIDIINMANPPSLFRSRLLYKLCDTFDLVDPYHLLHPSRWEYTYVPHAATTNRSRLDFFLITSNVSQCVKKCEINPYMGTALFDH
jgi:exonuclease III